MEFGWNAVEGIQQARRSISQEVITKESQANYQILKEKRDHQEEP